MYPSFTGSSRRPRQVNLSGRRSNPFAAVAEAQQERGKRQKERDRLNAARVIQRSWKGHKSRENVKAVIRREFDETESSVDATASSTFSQPRPYPDEALALSQMQRLLHLFKGIDASNIERLRQFVQRQSAASEYDASFCSDEGWAKNYAKLQRLVCLALDSSLASGVVEASRISLLQSLAILTQLAADHVSENAVLLYRVLARTTGFFLSLNSFGIDEQETIFICLTTPLQQFCAQTLAVYEAFGYEYLTLENLVQAPLTSTWLTKLSEAVNYKLLASSLAATITSPQVLQHPQMKISRIRLNLLAILIFFHRQAHRFHDPSSYSSHGDYVMTISALLASVANEEIEELDGDSFIQNQILSLVNQESIQSLLSGGSENTAMSSSGWTSNEEAKRLAGFALTLLRIFPKKGDDIRMWLYWGSASSRFNDAASDQPAIKYFWNAAKPTNVFNVISRSPREIVKLLNPVKVKSGSCQLTPSSAAPTDSNQDDWRVIFVFLELYTFVLKLMDDEEFFSPSSFRSGKSSAGSSWATQNALPMGDVKDLSIFLKNLAFSLYFYAMDISNLAEHKREPIRLSSYFNISAQSPSVDEIDKDSPPKLEDMCIAGLPGLNIEYVKGLVTGLLRAIYERDSRRRFLPEGHWLMTSMFDMDGFIPTVVEEEARRNQFQEEDEEEHGAGAFEMDSEEDHVIGSSRARRLRHQERLKLQQKRASRRRYMQLVSPRLEILQNMPFFIGFKTRVEIFKEFIRRDQMKRRGSDDERLWRVQMMNEHGDLIQRHHATIRRDHIFEDAFSQYHTLQDSFKEPINITFVDQFSNPEAGIDGGGVTKEFLTSVTKEAFNPDRNPQLFVTNDQHLLYPNPTIVEEVQERAQEAGLDSSAIQGVIRALLKHYEFLGQIIGKCLYEGILVDVGFAGFFLLKWALTGGAGSAPQESGYRANLNDLRDLDEELYQGLLKLKNYPGDVSDFSLTFTLNNTLTLSDDPPRTKITTVELRPDGANVPVTNANRLFYLSYLARYKLQIQPRLQTRAFLRGLGMMIDPAWLNMFNQAELQTLVGGASTSIDVDDLKAHTKYSGVYDVGGGERHPTMQMFWRVMRSITEEERKAVLKFVTSTPRGPLLGFGNLMPMFTIRDSGGDEARLPSTSTCVNLLKLPIYKSEKVLREKLLAAVFSGAGFDLS